MALLGLNPHNAEFKKDSEERKIILPAIKKLKKLGLSLSGPLEYTQYLLMIIKIMT